MPSIPATQFRVTMAEKHYSGVFSVSGALMIVRIPGVGSTNLTLTDEDPTTAAKALGLTLLEEAKAQGLLR